MSWGRSGSHSLPNGSLPLPFNHSLHQSLLSNGSLPLPFVPPLPPSPSWAEGGGAGGGTGAQASPEDRWTGDLAPDDWCHMSPAASACLVACYCVTLLLGLLGNCFVIGVIARRRDRANVTSVLIANLSVSDILVCAFCLPFTVTYTLMDRWPFGLALCRLVPFLQCVSVTVSVLSLVLIAMERHQLIVNPSGWKPSVSQAYMAVAAVWLLAGLTSLPFLAFHLLTDEPYAALARPPAPPPPPPPPPPPATPLLFTPASLPPQRPQPSPQPRPSPQTQDLEPSPHSQPPAPLRPSSHPQPTAYSQTSPWPPPKLPPLFPAPQSDPLSPQPPKDPLPSPPPKDPLSPPPAPQSNPPSPPPSPHVEVCMERWPSQYHKLAYTTWLLLFQFLGPLLLVLLCYVRVFLRLRRRRGMLDRARTAESQRVGPERRVNAMLAALVSAFTLCWLPLTVFNAVADWHHEALPVCHYDLLFSLCHLLAMLSTCVNPVIYGFLNSNFRQEFREGLLQCRCRPLEDNYQHFALSSVPTEVSRTSTSLPSTTGATLPEGLGWKPLPLSCGADGNLTPSNSITCL